MIKETFKTYEEALQFIKSYENEHGYKFIFRAVASGFTNKLTSLFHRKVLFGRDDLPYLHVSNGKSLLLCGLGGRKNPDNRTTRVTTGAPVVPRKRNYVKKLMRESEPCPAEIQIMSLVYFPEYKITSEMNKAEMSKMTDHLRKHFNAETCIPLYIVEIDEDHSNHTKPLEVIDQQTVQFIQDLVERGYYSPASITEQLEILYQTWPVKPDKKDPKFYPGLERIRRQIFPLVNKQRNIEREKGFTHDLDEALQRIRDFEKDTCTHYQCRDLDGDFGQHDVYIASRTNPVLTSTYSERRCRIDTGGVPYIIMGSRCYECSHGIDYKNKFIDPYTTAQRKNMDRKGNVMCTARCTLKEVALFPTYRIDSSITNKQLREAILEKLQEDLKKCKASYERVIAYAFPCVDEHCGHAYREANGVLFLDNRIKAQICELVSEGVRSVAEMRRHLKMYLKHQFDELSMPGPFNKKYRPSAQTIVNLMCEQGVQLEDIIQDVKDPVYYFPKSSDQHEIGKEQIQDVEHGTVVHMSNAENVQTPYDELVRSLEILQSEHNDKQKKTAEGKETAACPSEADVPNSEEAKQKGEDSFLDVVFRKQTECQSLLEEILQIVYKLSDVFKLRDLRELLVRVKDCLTDGKLLCDGVSIGGNSKHEQILQEKDKIDCNDGVSEIVIREPNDQITAVDIPDDSTEIVIYHTHDDLGEQIIVVKEASNVNEVITQSDANGMNVPANKDGTMEGLKKDFIKVCCKEFFSKEDILKKLNISESRIGRPNSSGGSSALHSKGDLNDLQTEIKNQEKELVQMEKDKASLSMMEMRVSKNDETSRNRNSTKKQIHKLGKTKRKCQTDSEIGTGMPKVKRAFASKSKDDDIAEAQEMDIPDNDVGHLESPSKKTAIKHTTCQTTENTTCQTAELSDNKASKVKYPSFSNSTSKQILPNQLVAVNNVVYSNTPMGLIPALTSAGMPLIIPIQNPDKQKINLTKLTSTTDDQQMQTESSNLNSSPSLLNKASENQLVNNPTVKQTFDIPNNSASCQMKQLNVPMNNQGRLTHANKQAQTICSTKHTSLTLDASLDGPQNQIHPADCEGMTNEEMDLDNVTSTRNPRSSPESSITPPANKVSNSQGMPLEQVKRLLSGGTKVKPGNIRVIKVKRNSSTDVNNQFTVADVRVNLSDTQKSGQAPIRTSSPTVRPVQHASSDSPALTESSSVVDAKLRHCSVENSKAVIETPASESPSGRSMKTRGRIVRFSKSGEILS